MKLGDPNDAFYSECVQEIDVPSLNKLREDIRQMRWHSGLEQYPYLEGIEGLRTSLICTLNILADLVDDLDRKSSDPVRR